MGLPVRTTAFITFECRSMSQAFLNAIDEKALLFYELLHFAKIPILRLHRVYWTVLEKQVDKYSMNRYSKGIWWLDFLNN